jgi:hypothetical protein
MDFLFVKIALITTMSKPPQPLPPFGFPVMQPMIGCSSIKYSNGIIFLEEEPMTPQVVFVPNPIFGFVERYNTAGDRETKIKILEEVKNNVCHTRTDIRGMLQKLIDNGPLPIEFAVSYGDKCEA